MDEPSRDSRRPAHWKSRLFVVLAIAIPLGVAFALLEGYVRLNRPVLDIYALTGRVIGRHPADEWALIDAFCAFRGKPGAYDKDKTVNSHGFISTPELALEKSTGTIRIAFLGGSSTAGTGTNLPDEQTWPWQTWAMLREKVPHKIEFLNGALSGYTSFESFGRLWSRIRPFEPDIVVVNHAWNEMYYFDDPGKVVDWRVLPDGSWSFERTLRPIKVYEPHWIDPFVRWSQVLTRLRLRMVDTVPGEVGGNDDTELEDTFDRRSLEIWRTNLRLMRETCDVIGARLFLVKQPTLIVPDLPPDLREKCQYRFHGLTHEAHVEAFQEIYSVIDDEMSSDAIIDLTPMSGKPEYFVDHVHPTPEGAEEIARRVSRALAAYLGSSM